MKKNILTAILCAAFASACTGNMGNTANTTAVNTNQTSNSTTSSANTANADKPKDSKDKTEKPKTTPEPQKLGAERIQLPKGEQVAVLSGTLGAKQSKKYVAYVIKGNLICIVPSDDLNANIKARLDGKEFDFRDSTCTEHQTQTKDHTIEIYNSGSGNSPFQLDVGFSEHG